MAVKVLMLVTSLLLIVTCIHAVSRADCPKKSYHNGKKCYFVTNRIAKWNKDCYMIDSRAVLVEIKSQAEQNSVQRALVLFKGEWGGKCSGFWTGGRKVGKTWKWQASRTTFSFTKWSSGKPGNQKCVKLDQSGQHWSTDNCMTKLCSVCQIQ